MNLTSSQIRKLGGSPLKEMVRLVAKAVALERWLVEHYEECVGLEEGKEGEEDKEDEA